MQTQQFVSTLKSQTMRSKAGRPSPWAHGTDRTFWAQATVGKHLQQHGPVLLFTQSRLNDRSIKGFTRWKITCSTQSLMSLLSIYQKQKWPTTTTHEQFEVNNIIDSRIFSDWVSAEMWRWQCEMQEHMQFAELHSA